MSDELGEGSMLGGIAEHCAVECCTFAALPRRFSPAMLFGRRTMQSLDESARDVLDSLQEGCHVVGFDYEYLYVNDALVRQVRLSREKLLGRTMMECYPGIEQQPFFPVLQRCMENRTREAAEVEFLFPDGRPAWFDLKFVPVPEGVCIISLETTQQREAGARLRGTEHQLRQSQKMEAIGLLAGGIAHDFNNLLTVINGFSQLLLTQMGESHPLAHPLSLIHTAGEKAAGLTRQLLAFSRKQILEPRILDLNEIVGDLDPILRQLIG